MSAFQKDPRTKLLHSSVSSEKRSNYVDQNNPKLILQTPVIKILVPTSVQSENQSQTKGFNEVKVNRWSYPNVRSSSSEELIFSFFSFLFQPFLKLKISKYPEKISLHRVLHQQKF